MASSSTNVPTFEQFFTLPTEEEFTAIALEGANVEGVNDLYKNADTPKIALHMQETDLHPKEPNPELPHVIPLVPGILHYVQESSEEL